MKNIFNEFQRQIYSPLNIVIILIIFLIILYPIYNHIEVENLSQLLQGGTMLLYSLYIPIAIAIIEDIFNKDEKTSLNIELRVVFSEIFNVRSNIYIIILTIISVLFVDTNNTDLKLIGLILWVGSNLVLICSIDKSGKYINSPNKTKYWLDIIEKKDKLFIDNINDIFNAISDDKVSIEKQSHKNDGKGFSNWSFEEENSFIDLILVQVSKYIKTNEYQNIYKLLNIIDNNIDKITFKYQNKKFISKLFEYSYIFWEKYQDYAENNGSPNKSIEIYRISEEILIKILQKSLQDPHPSSATIDFFEALDQHLQKYKDETIQFHGKEKSYFEFFKYFGDRVITEILNSKDEFVARDVLDYHWSKSDRNWNINLSNLESEKDNKITYYWLNRMLEYLYKTWKEQIFYTSTKKLEFKNIQKVNILLNSFMPNIDVVLFMRVVELVWFTRVVNESVKNYLEKRVFWFLDNVEMYIDNSSPEESLEYEKIIIEKQQRETVLLLKKIYQLNNNFYKDIKSQIEAIDLNSLDDEQKGRLESLQKTIEYFKDIK